MNKEQEIQKILHSKFMYGPKYQMDEALIEGINFFSGSASSAFYELWGNSSIFRLIVMQPSKTLFTSHYVGKDHLMFLLMEEEQVRGGFISPSENLLTEFKRIFNHVREEHVEELHLLWINYASIHYEKLNNTVEKY
ncbi:hypothetical protein DZB87_26500 [Bacillus sp. ALD]|nr:hypothetical protein DZB87_26500 [Bacillus sp. ALD]